MDEQPQWCRRGVHDVNVSGRGANGSCLACERVRDRARGPSKRAKRKYGDTPAEVFKPGDGFLFDSRGWGWRRDVIETTGRLRAICEWELRRDPDQVWAYRYGHALKCLDAGLSPAELVQIFYNDFNAGAFFEAEMDVEALEARLGEYLPA